MYLHRLYLEHFRNYTAQVTAFATAKTILVGANGQGKSNLLEAVAFLASLKSPRASRDRELVQFDQPQAQIAAQVERFGGIHELKIDLRLQGRRSVRVDGDHLRRQHDFLGHLNAVTFTSLDLDIVRGSPSHRRDWLDGMLVQLEPRAADLLQQYGHILRQRNALLKQDSLDQPQLLAWNEQLMSLGCRIIRRRQRLIERLQPLAAQWHQQISGATEQLQLHYEPNISESITAMGDGTAASKPEPIPLTATSVLEEQFRLAIANHQALERARGSSLVGPHRDEVQLTLNDHPARAYGSQGQQRTLVLALKLAELELQEAVLGEPPLLLLDDVLAELDLVRQEHLLLAIGNRVQTLITTTHLGGFGSPWLDTAQVLQVHQGQLRP